METVDSPHAYGPYFLGAYRDDPTQPTVAQFLAEPDRLSGGPWGAAVARRLLVMSTGPAAVAAEDPLPPEVFDRLRRAGVPTVPRSSNLEEARELAWPLLPALRRLAAGWGSPRPALVLVGDRTNTPRQAPFTSKAGVWLFAALRDLGWDELSLYLTNHSTCRKDPLPMVELRDVLAPVSPIWVALGDEAYSALRRLGIAARSTKHPSWHRRFRHHEGPIGYAISCLHNEAGVPFGPYYDPEEPVDSLLPSVPVDALPELTKPLRFDTISGSVNSEKAAIVRLNRARTLNPQVAEEARRRFVVDGENLKLAAKAVKAPLRSLKMLARLEDWDAERVQHAKRKTEAYYMADLEEEVVHAKQTRGLAAKAAHLAVASLVERLTPRADPTDPDAAPAAALIPTPGQSKQIVDAYLGLVGAEVGRETSEQNALRNVNLSELVDRARDTFEGFGGPPEKTIADDDGEPPHEVDPCPTRS